MTETVLQDQAGVVLGDGSQETLRDAILAPLDDGPRRAALGAAARRRVECDLDVRRLLDVVRDAAADARVG